MPVPSLIQNKTQTEERGLLSALFYLLAVVLVPDPSLT